jgi:acetyl esterase/lipase
VRRAAAALALVAALVAGCGGDEDAGRERQRFVVGSGPASATVVVPAGGSKGRLGVVFLHGWGMVEPETYGPWIDHLAARGHVVIAPRYQESGSSPSDQALPNAVRGVRAALERTPGLTALVTAGHSAGGALAADLAAIAPGERIPRPRAVFAVYPGRGLRGVFEPMPEVDLGAIPRSTRVVAWAGDDDPVVGTAPAELIARATGGRYRLIRDDAVDDHAAPQRSDAPSRRLFWSELDGLIGSVASG